LLFYFFPFSIGLSLPSAFNRSRKLPIRTVKEPESKCFGETLLSLSCSYRRLGLGFSYKWLGHRRFLYKHRHHPHRAWIFIFPSHGSLTQHRQEHHSTSNSSERFPVTWLPLHQAPVPTGSSVEPLFVMSNEKRNSRQTRCCGGTTAHSDISI